MCIKLGKCAAIGAADVLMGQVPVALACLNAGVSRDHRDICKELISLVREKIGPVAAFRHAKIVDSLPKTRSGKILRATMAKIADGEIPAVPAIIEEPAVLDEIKQALKSFGFTHPAKPA